ncbi:hypothetical protein ACS0PU_005764 [Formica fusca]
MLNKIIKVYNNYNILILQNKIKTFVTEQQSGTLLRRGEQFVGIPGNGVGELDALEKTAIRLGDEGAATPRCVHVKPQCALPANFGDFLEGIEGAHHGGARGGRYHERHSTLLDGSGNLSLQIGDHHLASGINFDQINVVVTDTQEGGKLLYGIVCILRREHHQPRHLR